MRAYATPSDLANTPWLLTVDGQEAESLLRRATIVVEGLTMTARYGVDADGMPTSPTILEAFRDAVCAQAVWFDETGDTTGASSRYNSVSLGSFAASGGGTGSGTNTTVEQSRYAPEMVSILRTAGLLSQAPVS